MFVPSNITIASVQHGLAGLLAKERIAQHTMIRNFGLVFGTIDLKQDVFHNSST